MASGHKLAPVGKKSIIEVETSSRQSTSPDSTFIPKLIAQSYLTLDCTTEGFTAVMSYAAVKQQHSNSTGVQC